MIYLFLLFYKCKLFSTHKFVTRGRWKSQGWNKTGIFQRVGFKPKHLSSMGCGYFLEQQNWTAESITILCWNLGCSLFVFLISLWIFAWDFHVCPFIQRELPKAIYSLICASLTLRTLAMCDGRVANCCYLPSYLTWHKSGKKTLGNVLWMNWRFHAKNSEFCHKN